MKKFVFTSFMLMMLVLSACNMPGATGGLPPADPAAATAAESTRVAESVAQTLAAAMSEMPPVTATASLTPEPSATFTPEVPTVSVSAETNCRTGPAIGYDLISKLVPGQTAEVIGRDSYGNYWVIKNPGGATPAFCWLWGQYATITGDWQPLPVFDTPPTPTPMATFTATYDGMITCMSEYAFRFRITNPGSVTWESVQVVVTDTVTSTINTHIADSFKERSGCEIDNELQNLETGEPGVVATAIPGQFTYNPSGHAMTAVITLCPQNGLAGECVSKTVSFTP